MKSNDAVRSPVLINSGSIKNSDSKSSVGAVLKKAQRDLFISRIVSVFLFLLLIALLFLAYSYGLHEEIIDRFFSLMG